MAKEYVARFIGDEYIIPTLGTWNHFDEIDFNTLPAGRGAAPPLLSCLSNRIELRNHPLGEHGV